jgi:hypothetical protein
LHHLNSRLCLFARFSCCAIPSAPRTSRPATPIPSKRMCTGGRDLQKTPVKRDCHTGCNTRSYPPVNRHMGRRMIHDFTTGLLTAL